ncbi:MAG: phosphatase PAP2 family protein [Thermoleophilia bacterium]
MDLDVFRALNGFAAAHDGFEDTVRVFVQLALVVFGGLVILLFVTQRGPERIETRRSALAAGAGALLALALAQPIAHLVDRPRPYVAHPDVVHLYLSRTSDPSFPSDHATAAFAIAVAILLRNRRAGLVVLALAAILAAGRVLLGVHYPADVLAGAMLGSLVSLAIHASPARRALDRASDILGRVWDDGTRRVRTLVRPSG